MTEGGKWRRREAGKNGRDQVKMDGGALEPCACLFTEDKFMLGSWS
jgi:hypothetical protein